MKTNKNIGLRKGETHWFELGDNCLLELRNNLLYELINQGLTKAGNLNKLSKELNLSSPTFYNLINKRKIKLISVMKLKKLLSYLNFDYSFVNHKIQNTRKGEVISIESPIFPINLENKHGAYLLGLIVSDGCIYVDKKSRNQIRTKYAAGSKESEKIFESTLRKVFGKVHFQKEYVRNCVIYRIGSSIVGDSLLKAGAILGRKATVDGPVPWIIKQGSKKMKISYLKAAFDDEGCVYKEKSRDCGFITLSRYRHILNLTDKQKGELKKLELLMRSRTFPTGHVTKTIPLKSVISQVKDAKLINELKKPSQLLTDEAQLLNDLGINTRLFGRYLTKTHSGRYSLCYDLYINRKESLKKFYKEVSFSLTHKRRKLQRLVGGSNVTVVQHINKKKRTI